MGSSLLGFHRANFNFNFNFDLNFKFTFKIFFNFNFYKRAFSYLTVGRSESLTASYDSCANKVWKGRMKSRLAVSSVLAAAALYGCREGVAFLKQVNLFYSF